MLRGEGAEGPAVLCKFSQRVEVKLDDFVELQHVEIRATWKNTSGSAPEACVIAGLSGRELSVNNGKKRNQASLQPLVLNGCVFWRPPCTSSTLLKVGL